MHMANFCNINRVVEGNGNQTIDQSDRVLKTITVILVSGSGGGEGDLSNYVSLTGASSQVISRNITITSTFQSPSISTD